jgi:hypothetical protein
MRSGLLYCYAARGGLPYDVRREFECAVPLDQQLWPTIVPRNGWQDIRARHVLGEMGLATVAREPGGFDIVGKPTLEMQKPGQLRSYFNLESMMSRRIYQIAGEHVVEDTLRASNPYGIDQRLQEPFADRMFTKIISLAQNMHDLEAFCSKR